jgi:hypothetical protein
MPATMAEIAGQGAMPELYSPVTGRLVYRQGMGFKEDAKHSPHLRFFIDWIGQVWVADPQAFSENVQAYLQQIVDIWQDEQNEDESQNALVAKCLEVLPQSAFVLEILDPPWGPYSGEICYVCFDATVADGQPETIRMVGVWQLDSGSTA